VPNKNTKIWSPWQKNASHIPLVRFNPSTIHRLVNNFSSSVVISVLTIIILNPKSRPKIFLRFLPLVDHNSLVRATLPSKRPPPSSPHDFYTERTIPCSRFYRQSLLCFITTYPERRTWSWDNAQKRRLYRMLSPFHLFLRV